MPEAHRSEGRVFRDAVVRITDLTVTQPILEGYEFTRCRIIGPAVLGLLDNVSLEYLRWDAPGVDAIFWPVPPERGPVVGIIGVRHCRFVECVMENIGIAGPPELRQSLETEISDREP